MKILTNLTLGKKIVLLTMVGLTLGIGVFSFLSIQAVGQATETMLQERLTTAQLVADYTDETLNRAFTELQNTAQKISIEDVNGDIASHIEALEDNYYRLSIHIQGVFIINSQGQVIWSKPKPPTIKNFNIQLYPGIRQAIEKGESNISGLVSTLYNNNPNVLIVSPIKESPRGNTEVLVVAVDLSQSGISGFVQPIRLGETG
ncbi:MAG: cache domain-containing protein, partial [Candidatus Margulisiibacteriota bacterium]